MSSNTPTKRTAPSNTSPAPPTAKKSRFVSSSPSTSTSSQSAFKWLPSIGARRSLVHGINGNPQPSSKIAAFDFDQALVRPSGGGKWYDSPVGWELWQPHRPEAVEGEEEEESPVVDRLRELHADGFSIVIFTTRVGENDQWKHFSPTVRGLADALKVPFRLFCARDYDIYRKPVYGAWLEFVQNWNGGKEVDVSKSFYVGDASGKGKSIADWDRKFARNIGVPFHRPEEFFCGAPRSEYTYKGFLSATYKDPDYLFSPTKTPLIPRPASEFDEPILDFVLFVGAPRSGKTTFFEKHFAQYGYIRISGNDLYSSIRKHLTSSPSSNLVVDSLLPNRASRSRLIRLVRQLPPSHRIRAFHFTAPEELCKHNNVFAVLFEPDGGGEKGKKRELTTEGEYRAYYGALEVPSTEEEDLDEVKQINFQYDHSLGGPERFKQWKMFLNCYPRPAVKK
ncbi:hypothetical protein JCM8547_007325 [Rhodosporidiobolus lusitaniae]